MTVERMSGEDLRDLILRVSARGSDIPFDIPVAYGYDRLLLKRDGYWPCRDEHETRGQGRWPMDQISFVALYPEMTPCTEENAAECACSGWGRRIKAGISRPLFPDKRHWRTFFDSVYPRLSRLPESPEVPGMIHYHAMGRDIYLSHDHPADELIEISCISFARPEIVSPRCRAERLVTIAGTRFRLYYHFARAYLPQWRDIDARVKALFERFAADAACDQ